jgi:Kef-type K+ transport system membrane component KefB
VAWKAGLAGTLVILVGLIFRSIGTYLSLLGTPFDWRERLFCVVAYIPKATVQAAIGAIPLAAGVASGEVILAVAVLSIILTAPIGAIGIMIFGEKVLDHGEMSVYKFKELREKLALPHVGERVRSKQSGKVWKVIEQKEVWQEDTAIAIDPSISAKLIPAIYLRYWQEETSPGPNQGKTISYRYTFEDPSFDENWEILYDW